MGRHLQLQFTPFNADPLAGTLRVGADLSLSINRKNWPGMK